MSHHPEQVSFPELKFEIVDFWEEIFDFLKRNVEFPRQLGQA
jgi:hypothetical protein